MLIRLSIIISYCFYMKASLGQTTFIPMWAKEGWLLDRMEIKAQTEKNLNHSNMKPLMRKISVEVADSFRQLLIDGKNPAKLTKIDQYNLDRFQANNSEFSRFDTASMPQWKSKKDFLGFLWPTKGNAFEVDTKDFYLSVNPVVNQQQSIETDFSDKRVFVNAKGLALRGMIANKIGFHLYATDNQELGPIQWRQFVDSNRAVPGAGFNKNFKEGTGRDYFDARGSVSWNVTDFINMQFGFDQHFIGPGYRSIFMGNFAAPNLFLKSNSRYGKFNYTNIFSELYSPIQPRGDVLNPKQYSATHHLSFHATPWLNIGAFENVIFGEIDALNLRYLQPVIFLNTLLRNKDGNDNAMVGFDAKANIAKQVQVYGQVMMQAFNGEKQSGSDFWGNRHGFQAGAKYIDAFGLKNLDLQAEFNQIRPFTYSSPENAGSWTNYRVNMAHPLGSNFREYVGTLRYQPFKRLYIFGRVNYWQQGRDSATFNFGSNPRFDNSLLEPFPGGRRLRDNGYPMFAGTSVQGLNTAITFSYEIKENLFLDANNMYRLFKNSRVATPENTNIFTLGIRWNMFRRDYDY
jgi:hypothetical protein